MDVDVNRQADGTVRPETPKPRLERWKMGQPARKMRMGPANRSGTTEYDGAEWRGARCR